MTTRSIRKVKITFVNGEFLASKIKSEEMKQHSSRIDSTFSCQKSLEFLLDRSTNVPLPQEYVQMESDARDEENICHADFLKVTR